MMNLKSKKWQNLKHLSGLYFAIYIVIALNLEFFAVHHLVSGCVEAFKYCLHILLGDVVSNGL